MTNLIVLLFSFFGALNAFAFFDLQAQGSARSYPEGGILGVAGGWNQLLWERENQEDAATPWKYGYVRPWAQLQSIGFTHRGSAELEIFPVSIFGIGVGYAFSERTANKNSTFDCNQMRCDGSVQRNYLKILVRILCFIYIIRNLKK
jgi:hypothetical protein